MKIGEISEPIKKQNNLIFLKLSDKKLSSVENIDINEMRKKLINKKKMTYLIYILEVIYQSLKTPAL